MISIGCKLNEYDIRQDQTTKEVTIWRGHQLYYRGTEDKLLTFDELQVLLFSKVRVKKHGI